ncbi:MAG: hypothetical protein KDK45_17870, partial [Leptospiraceae bacterium]|nr:hypothetical protein [Leptospiraceae bacterium]
MDKPKGLSGKGLAKQPGGGKKGSSSFHHDDKGAEFAQKREEARRIAAEKAKSRTLAKQQQISERIATASEQLSSGIQEGSSASEELMRAMQQIASGAEEASSSSEESKATATQIEKNAQINSNLAQTTMDKVNLIQTLTTATSNDIRSLIEGVNKAATAAIQTANLMQDLEKKSEEVGNILQSVVRIADQTNLLALNAAIEAARAGEHGRGFAIVADEVRNLAETSEKSANQIKDVVADIQAEVRKVVQEVNNIGATAKEESAKGTEITNGILGIANAMVQFQKITDDTNVGINNILELSKEYLSIAENIAASAEEISASAEQSRKGTEQQAKAFSEMSSASEELAQTAEELKNSTNMQKSAEELASMSEQLSANIEEALSASQELSSAIEQIQKATEIQSRETNKGVEVGERIEGSNFQIEKNASSMQTQVKEIAINLTQNKLDVDKMISNIGLATEKNFEAAKSIRTLSEKTLAIDKIVETIINVTIKTDMLAVSGSIEAARAGEHGKGFSVVSGDIRNLATESSQSADQIKDLVRSLSLLVDTSAINVETAANLSQTEVAKAKESTRNLELIEADIKTIENQMGEMVKNAQEAKQANEEAKKAI